MYSSYWLHLDVLATKLKVVVMEWFRRVCTHPLSTSDRLFLRRIQYASTHQPPNTTQHTFSPFLLALSFLWYACLVQDLLDHEFPIVLLTFRSLSRPIKTKMKLLATMQVHTAAVRTSIWESEASKQTTKIFRRKEASRIERGSTKSRSSPRSTFAAISIPTTGVQLLCACQHVKLVLTKRMVTWQTEHPVEFQRGIHCRKNSSFGCHDFGGKRKNPY